MSGDAAHSAAAVVEERRPWPGLVAFSEAQSDCFFGRSSECAELLERVRHDITTVLFGRSGLGKTSLLHAGLFPRLREHGFLPISVRLEYAVDSGPLINQIKARLTECFLAARLQDPPSFEPDESLWEYFHRRDGRLIDPYGEPIIPVVVFDQFEELFTLGLGGPRNAECQGFLEELGDFVENRPSSALKERLGNSPERASRYVFRRDDYRIVISLREDFLPALHSLRVRAPSLGRSHLRLARMGGRQALEAVIKPGGDLVAPDLAAKIVRYVGELRREDTFSEFGAEHIDSTDSMQVDPALLSLFCSELNERRILAKLPRLTEELFSGSRQDILSAFYERTLQDQPPVMRELIEERLVSPRGVRESISRESFEDMLAKAGVANPRAALDTLIGRFLLHVEDRPEGPRLELVHDVLTETVRRSRDQRREHEAATAAKAREEALRRNYVMRMTRILAVAASILLIVSIAVFFYVRERLHDIRMEAQIREQKIAEEANNKLAGELLGTFYDTLMKSRNYTVRIPESMWPLVEKIADFAGHDPSSGKDFRVVKSEVLAMATLAFSEAQKSPDKARGYCESASQYVAQFRSTKDGLLLNLETTYYCALMYGQLNDSKARAALAALENGITAVSGAKGHEEDSEIERLIGRAYEEKAIILLSQSYADADSANSAKEALDQSLGHRQRAVDIARQMYADKRTESEELAAALDSLGRCLLFKGKLKESEERSREARELLRSEGLDVSNIESGKYSKPDGSELHGTEPFAHRLSGVHSTETSTLAMEIDVNLAHARLLQGQQNEALEIYEKVGTLPGEQHVTIAGDVESDFSILRKLGIPSSEAEKLMAVVEEKLGVGTVSAQPPP